MMLAAKTPDIAIPGTMTERSMRAMPVSAFMMCASMSESWPTLPTDIHRSTRTCTSAQTKSPIRICSGEGFSESCQCYSYACKTPP